MGTAAPSRGDRVIDLSRFLRSSGNIGELHEWPSGLISERPRFGVGTMLEISCGWTIGSSSTVFNTSIFVSGLAVDTVCNIEYALQSVLCPELGIGWPSSSKTEL